MGYNLCIVASFGNFQILSFFQHELFFRAVFLQRRTLSCLQKRFSHVLCNFFLFKLSILHELQPLHFGHFLQFSRCFHISNISCFFELFFAQNKFNVFVETFFARFRHFIFSPNLSICMGYSLCIVAIFVGIFIMLSFSEYQLFFRTLFLHRTT